MINTGDMVVNPSTGERLIFRQTSADTGGRLVEVEAIITPDGACAGAHVHPNQEERFQVIEGLVGFRKGREKIVAEPGDTVVVPAGTVHRFWNAGDIDARFVCQVTPALQFEALIETMFGLAADRGWMRPTSRSASAAPTRAIRTPTENGAPRSGRS